MGVVLGESFISVSLIIQSTYVHYMEPTVFTLCIYALIRYWHFIYFFFKMLFQRIQNYYFIFWVSNEQMIFNWCGIFLYGLRSLKNMQRNFLHVISQDFPYWNKSNQIQFRCGIFHASTVYYLYMYWLVYLMMLKVIFIQTPK